MEQTPRQRVKALTRGEPVARPLLMPEIFALGSRLENLPLRDFLSNPTKIANALRQIRATLRVDGLMCYSDPGLETEALGGTVVWNADGTRRMDTPPRDVERRMEKAGGILQMGRVPVALEVVRRLKTILKDEPALMVRVTGVHTLAQQLGDDALSLAAEVVATLVRGYLEAGADVVLMEETLLPSAEEGAWRSAIDPIVNAIRFYEALPVLRIATDREAEAAEFLASQTWECALCLASSRGTNADWNSVAPWIGLDIPLASSSGNPDVPEICNATWTTQISFLSGRDLPRETDLKSLTHALSALRGQEKGAV